MNSQKKLSLGIIVTITLILLIPLIAMQFTNEVNWTIQDFVIAGAILFTAGFILNLIITKVKSKTTKLWLTITLLLVFILIWMELAIGIFGTAIAGS